MASIEKRKLEDGTISYRAKIRLKGYPPENATFQRLTDARNWAQQTEADIKAGRYFGLGKKRTVEELIDAYEKSQGFKKLKSKEWVQARLKWWRSHYGKRLLQNLIPALIAEGRDALLDEQITVLRRNDDGDVCRVPLERKRSGSTTNRYIAALSSACGYGMKELGWLERNPVERVTKPKENKGRIRYLNEEELPKFLAACRKNDDLYLAVLLSLTTGARKSEIMGLRWSQIDFKNKRAILHAGATKNDDARSLPLVGETLALLNTRARICNLNDDRIFPPTSKAKKAIYISLDKPFENLLKETCIDDFHWHDLRHTCASYLMMSGITPLEISKILGHKTMAMVIRYTHLAPDRANEIGNHLSKRMGI